MQKNRRVPRVTATVVTLVLVGGISIFVYWANRPVATTTQISKDVRGATSIADIKPVTNTYYATYIPSSLSLKTRNPAHGNTLDQMFWTAATHSINNPISDQLAITIGTNPSEGLNGLTDVQLRLRNNKTYQVIDLDYLPKDALVFTKNTDGYEIGVFLVHANHYAAVVYAGTADRVSQLNDSMRTTIGSWQWQ